MKKRFLIFFIFCFAVGTTSAQIDFENLNLKDILGKVVKVERGFAPKFSLGNIRIPKIPKVAEILGLKKNVDVNRLFNTFRTGRTIFQITSYAGTAIAVYGLAKQLKDSATSSSRTALTSGLVSIGTGLLVKFLTKAASYKAVDIFNGIAARKIKDIFSIKPASSNLGVGLYVKLD
jgi:hypothetical protein